MEEEQSSFRQSFISKLLTDVENKAMYVKPAEVGILRERYIALYNNTDNGMKSRLYEQLCISMLLWTSASADILCPNDDLEYVRLMTTLRDIVQTSVRQYSAAAAAAAATEK